MATDKKDLKNLLHESVERVDDEELLQMAKDVLDRKYESAEIVSISEYQKQRLEKSKQSAARGETMTNEQADEFVYKWLNE